MNKRDAKKLAEAGSLTAGELRAMIAAARGKLTMSRVNPRIPHDRALDIYDAALAERDPAARLIGMIRDPYSDRIRPSRDSLIVRNILVDCAPAERSALEGSRANLADANPNHAVQS